MKNSKNKHTEGPWNRGDVVEIPWGSEKAQVMCIESGDTIVGLSVVRGPFIDDICDESEAEANARLIATAPEMLEALEGMQKELMRMYKMTSRLELNDVTYGGDLNEAVMSNNEYLKSVIKKARGE